MLFSSLKVITSRKQSAVFRRALRPTPHQPNKNQKQVSELID
jgi:hypothetical protein